MTIVQWQCTVTRNPQFSAQYKEGLTVGELASLLCQGQAVAWPPEAQKLIKFDLATEEQFRLKLLKVLRLEDKQAQFLITSYQIAKQPQLANLSLVAGDMRVAIEPFNMQMQSVLKEGGAGSTPSGQGKGGQMPPAGESTGESSAQTQQPPQPYGPFGPIKLEYPLWIWSVVIVPVVVGLGIFIFWLRKRSKIKKTKIKAQALQTALTPADQFMRDTRLIGKRSYGQDTLAAQFVTELKIAIDQFLLREFCLEITSSDKGSTKPAKKKSEKSGKKNNEKNNEKNKSKKYETLSKNLQKILKCESSQLKGFFAILQEIEQTLKSPNISLVDVEQLLNIARKQIQILADRHRMVVKRKIGERDAV